MTAGSSPSGRRRAAFRACLAALLMLAVFAVAGGAIFAFFGITVPAFQIAGGMIFTLISMRTLDEGREDVPEDDATSADPFHDYIPFLPAMLQLGHRRNARSLPKWI